jgi:hypothetical protein
VKIFLIRLFFNLYSDMTSAGEFLSKLEKSVDASFEPTFVIPGEDVTTIVSSFRKEISIGNAGNTSL